MDLKKESSALVHFVTPLPPISGCKMANVKRLQKMLEWLQLSWNGLPSIVTGSVKMETNHNVIRCQCIVG